MYIWIPTDIIYLCCVTRVNKDQFGRSLLSLFWRKSLSNLHDTPLPSIHGLNPTDKHVDPPQQKPECSDSQDSKKH